MQRRRQHQNNKSGGTSFAPNRVSLTRALSKLGILSRSKAFSEILGGKVTVNGIVERNPRRWVDLVKHRIVVEGRSLLTHRRRYILLNKPPDVVTTASDEKGRRTVYNILEFDTEGLIPVGRLDKDTTGLLLFTNDHRLAEFLTNPSSSVPKTYVVKVDRTLRSADLEKLSSGTEFGIKGMRFKVSATNLRRIDSNTVELSITQGKNRQVRRMMEAIGCQVVSLQRKSIGPLSLDGLPMGKFRPLGDNEIRSLRNLMSHGKRYSVPEKGNVELK